MSIKKKDRPIVSMDDWLIRAGPKSKGHWVAGRSAMETARAWLGAAPGSLPREIESLLSASSYFGRPIEWEAEPEAKLRFDSFVGEPRNSDLLVVARDAHGPYIIAVEAKADETFGETVAKARSNAAKRKASNPRSNGLLRIDQLLTALLGPEDADSQFGALRYQLLTATAGALAEAERRGTGRAIMLVQEFVTDRTTDDNHRGNAQDLDRFIQRLSGDSQLTIVDGQLVGPFAVPGVPLFEPGTQLFVGKVVRRIRTSQEPAEASDVALPLGETNGFGFREIPHAALTLADVPTGRPFDWREFATFALSFDGYENVGPDCGTTAMAFEREFRDSGRLPSNLIDLRLCVFFVQRQYRDDVITREAIDYIRALLEAVRTNITAAKC